MGRKRLVVSLESETLNHIESVAKELEMTRNALVEDSLRYFFDHLDIYLAEKRLADPGDAVIAGEKVWKRLGL
ncbi:MAG TPA: hypothetical protein PLV42_09730 [bacterium]|nr:hypothetical protein [bacterium]